MLVVSYKNYVFADGLNLVMYSFLPIYLLGQNLICYKEFRDIWMKMASLFTMLLPVFYLFRQSGYISYFDIGFLAHLNILIIVYHILSSNKNKNDWKVN